MKKYITGIAAVVLMIAGCTEDVDKWSDVQRDMNVGGAMPYTRFSSSKIFDIVDLDNSSIDFTLYVGAEGKGQSLRR